MTSQLRIGQDEIKDAPPISEKHFTGAFSYGVGYSNEGGYD
jgi:hypothetical protein